MAITEKSTLVGEVMPEFIDECYKRPFSVCGACGGSLLAHVDPLAKNGNCLNPNCRGDQDSTRGGMHFVKLAPSLASIAEIMAYHREHCRKQPRIVKGDDYGKRFVGIRETHLELPENFSLDDI